ncbi:MAG: acyl-CoA dehydrogenase family protein, partial [bacterium]
MTVAETVRGTQSASDLISQLNLVAEAATTLRDRAVAALSAKLASGGKIDNAALEREQHAAHGLAWIATYVEALRQIADYAKRLDGEGRFGEIEALLCQIGGAEYAVQLMGGVVMSQN